MFVSTGADSRSGAEDVTDLEEVEMLREIWSKQGVGKDGYLSFDELGAICENMGMEKMSDKVSLAWADSKTLCTDHCVCTSVHGEKVPCPTR